MLKVMVVEDEPWVRRGIVQAIEWDRLGLRLAGEAEDGDEAIELADKEAPDIVVMDMRMPGMDGVELIRAFARRAPDAVVLVCSGFTDFEYTKEAIVNRAFDYLLKPIKDADLNAALAKAATEAKLRKSAQAKESQYLAQRDAATASRLKEALESQIEPTRKPDETDLGELFPTGAAYVCVCGFERIEGDEKQAEAAIRSEAQRYFSETAIRQPCVLNITSGEMAVVLPIDRATDGEGSKAILEGLMNAVHSACRATFSIGTAEARGIGSGAQALHRAYKAAIQALGAKRLAETGAILRAGDRQAAEPNSAYSSERENQLLYLLTMGNVSETIAAYDEWFAAVRKDNGSIAELRKALTLLVGSIDKLLHASAGNLEAISGKSAEEHRKAIASCYDAERAISCIRRIAEEVCAFFGQMNKKDGRKVVADIVKDTQDRYAEPLSLNLYARKHHLNADYLSRLFKEETGRNFSDYLTELRVNKAIALLDKDANRNYEIAEMVGYEDYRHFSQVFKKATGSTLGEYREKLRQVRNSNTNR